MFFWNKDAFKWSKVKVKTFIKLQNISISNKRFNDSSKNSPNFFYCSYHNFFDIDKN